MKNLLPLILRCLGIFHFGKQNFSVNLQFRNSESHEFRQLYALLRFDYYRPNHQ